ncbi:MAG: DUF4258 domain-containing protein [Anaerolineae bacterium]
MDIEQVKALIRQRRYKTSHHAKVEREAETITIDDIKTAILNGELLEDYPDDPRGHSCLILGTAEDGRPLHIILTILTLGLWTKLHRHMQGLTDDKIPYMGVE